MDYTPLTNEQIAALNAWQGGSGPNAAKNPSENPEAFEFFAFVVDGSVAVVFVASKEHMAKEIAAWSSGPTIVKLTDQQKNVVLENWNYNNQTGEFSQPE